MLAARRWNLAGSDLLQKPRILIVGDSERSLKTLREKLECASYSVIEANTLSDARVFVKDSRIELVIARLADRENKAQEVLELVRESPLGSAALLIQSSKAQQEIWRLSLRWLEEQMSEPLEEADFFAAVEHSLEKTNLRRELAACGLIGVSGAMQEVFRSISKVASKGATILISGESGTGKELVAAGVHYLGPRRSKLFVPLVCGAIPENLLESQMFGHLKGAFTGANETRQGFFQAADGGSIFLDEISETTLAMQVKLLRVLQDKEVYPVGSTKGRTVDVRVLAATNKDLSDLVERGLFREDLYYRLNVLPIELPPLRDRGEDICILIHYFADKFASEYEVPEPSFTASALKVLESYYWPGNVRELENVIQRVVLMADGDEIDFADLPPLLRSIRQKVGLHRTLAEVEREHIREVLASVGNNKTRAAEILGIDRKTLRNKLKQFELING